MLLNLSQWQFQCRGDKMLWRRAFQIVLLALVLFCAFEMQLVESKQRRWMGAFDNLRIDQRRDNKTEDADLLGLSFIPNRDDSFNFTTLNIQCKINAGNDTIAADSTSFYLLVQYCCDAYEPLGVTVPLLTEDLVIKDSWQMLSIQINPNSKNGTRVFNALNNANVGKSVTFYFKASVNLALMLDYCSIEVIASDAVAGPNEESEPLPPVFQRALDGPICQKSPCCSCQCSASQTNDSTRENKDDRLLCDVDSHQPKRLSNLSAAENCPDSCQPSKCAEKRSIQSSSELQYNHQAFQISSDDTNPTTTISGDFFIIEKWLATVIGGILTVCLLFLIILIIYLLVCARPRYPSKDGQSPAPIKTPVHTDNVSMWRGQADCSTCQSFHHSQDQSFCPTAPEQDTISTGVFPVADDEHIYSLRGFK